jgi:hypothetical protein
MKVGWVICLFRRRSKYFPLPGNDTCSSNIHHQPCPYTNRTIYLVVLMCIKCRRKSNPTTGLDRTWGFQRVEASRFQDNRHMKVVRLSALCTSRLYPPGIIPGTHFCWRLSQPQGHSAARMIMSMKYTKGKGKAHPITVHEGSEGK